MSDAAARIGALNETVRRQGATILGLLNTIATALPHVDDPAMRFLEAGLADARAQCQATNEALAEALRRLE